MSGDELLRLSSLEFLLEPFPYFTASEGFGGRLSRAILDWLETEAPWALVETDFYEQHEFSLSDVSLPSHLSFLAERTFIDDLRSKVEHIFGARLGSAVDCTVHKLVPGQRIRIHNDFIPGEATHRVLVQLNRGWHDNQGGFLMFFNSPNPSDVHRIFSPTHDSVVIAYPRWRAIHACILVLWKK
jgi:Rps23 Pro-64 3,4-dihydroxylase Tpa1-like proline 4-hydroxylase